VRRFIPKLQLTRRPVERVLRVRSQSEARKQVTHEGTFALVVPDRTPKSLVFQCPCGCGDVISLNLMRGSTRAWRLSISRGGRLSLSPSVDRTTGCRSHFWIIDGEVHLYRLRRA